MARAPAIRRLTQILFFLLTGQWLLLGMLRCPFGVPFVCCGACPLGDCSGTFLQVPFIGLILVSGVAFGRVFCAWVCPLGCLEDALGLAPKLDAERRRWFAVAEPWLRGLKYAALAAVVWLVVTCNYPAGRPYPYAVRSPSLFNWESVFVAARLGASRYPVRAAILALALVSGLLITRFWCRYVCPLGALLGLFNRVSLWAPARIEARCALCAECESACAQHTAPGSVDCVACGDCVPDCPHNAIRFGWRIGRPQGRGGSQARAALLGLAFTAAAAAGGQAGTDQATPADSPRPVLHLADVVVRGRPEDDAVLEPLAPAPSQVLTTVVVGRDDIELQRPPSVPDAIVYTPAIQVNRKGRRCGLSLSLRGEGNLNVLLDGMNLQAREDCRFVEFMPASMVEEIRIVRDSTALIYGPPQLSSPNGIIGFGGALDVRLREPTESRSGEFRTEFGRFRECVQHLHLSGPVTERLGYVVSADSSSYDGRGGENMGRGLSSFLGRLVHRYSGESSATLTLMHEDGWRELQRAEAFSFFADRVEEYDPLRTSICTARVNHVWDPDASTTVEAYYRDHESVYIPHDNGTDNDVRETKRGLHLRQTVRFPAANTLRAGGQLGCWRNPTGKFHYFGSPRKEDDYGLYLQDELAVVPERLTLDAGVRWDRRYVDEGWTADGPAFGVGTGKGTPFQDRWRDPAVSTSVGVRLEVSDRQVLAVRFAVSEQAANSDLATRAGTQLGNARETRLELGWEFRPGESMTLGLTAFRKEIENGARYAGRYKVGPDWYPFWEENDFERSGLEVRAEGEIRGGLSCFANCAYVNSTNETLAEHDDTIPQYLVAGGLRYRRRPWRAAVFAKYTADYDSDFGTTPSQVIEVGDFWLIDANISRTVATGDLEHEVYGGVRNLANERYQTVPGWRAPGRSLYGGYALRF